MEDKFGLKLTKMAINRKINQSFEDLQVFYGDYGLVCFKFENIKNKQVDQSLQGVS